VESGHFVANALQAALLICALEFAPFWECSRWRDAGRKSVPILVFQ